MRTRAVKAGPETRTIFNVEQIKVGTRRDETASYQVRVNGKDQEEWECIFGKHTKR